jgi:uncharacterized membrane protein (DUF441 family)
MRAPPPPIHTEPVPASEVVRAQFAGQILSGQLNPTDANLKTAGIAVVLIAGMGILLAVRNPKFALGIMTGTLGASILAGYVALSATGQPTALANPYESSSS